MPPSAVRTARPSRGLHLVQIDALTLEGLYRAYSSYVAAIALRLLGRDDDVDDVVQDVFLSAWKGVANLRDTGAIKAWLATVTLRTARRRPRTRRVKILLRLDDEPDYANVASAQSGGGVYDPVADSCTALPTMGAPTPRVHGTVVWTGTDAIVWGGARTVGDPTTVLSDGARFKP